MRGMAIASLRRLTLADRYRETSPKLDSSSSAALLLCIPVMLRRPAVCTCCLTASGIASHVEASGHACSLVLPLLAHATRRRSPSSPSSLSLILSAVSLTCCLSVSSSTQYPCSDSLSLTPPPSHSVSLSHPHCVAHSLFLSFVLSL